MRLVVLGLSLSSSWGNGHATTFRALLSAFARRGHEVVFLERDMPWYASHRDLPDPDWCRLVLYDGLDGLDDHRGLIREADAVMVGSYVPDGIAVGSLVQAEARGRTAFYDIDTPVTLASIRRGDCAYLTPALIEGYDLYASFTGGPILRRIETAYGSPAARALYCSVDPDLYRPLPGDDFAWDLSYLGTYSPDRQPTLDALLIEPARRRPDLRFAVAGPQYPEDLVFPDNVERITHVGPADHPAFYGRSRFTLNVTRADMKEAGWSPSVRLFEAAACGVPILSDSWDGLDTLLRPGRDILLPTDAAEVVDILDRTDPETRDAIGRAGRQQILARHTSDHRAEELEVMFMSAPYRRKYRTVMSESYSA